VSSCVRVENTDAIPFEYEPAHRKVRYIAPQATQLLEYTLEELADDAFFASVTHPDDRDRVRAAIESFARSDAAGGMVIDCRMLTRSKTTIHVRTFLSSRSADGQIVRGVMLDLTKQRQLEAELAHAHKLESVGRLAAGVAHEINTPVQFVSDSVQFVRDTVGDMLLAVDKHRACTRSILAGAPSTDDARAAEGVDTDVDLPYLVEQFPKALDRALDGLGRVASIVRSMKVFAHPDHGEMTAIDLNEAIESTLTIARNEYKYVADVETELGDLPQVVCYPGEINQVILNIVVNAAHAIADLPGRVERGTIRVQTRVDGEHVVISIADSGAGIPEQVRDRIFDPFFTTKQVGRGTGQGLAIARSVIVDKHGGTIHFESELGRGTTFHVRLPVTHEAAGHAPACFADDHPAVAALL
jgi:signal transduction histidine kinase